MLHPPTPNEQKVEIASPYGKWRVSVMNFRSLSEPFRLLFAPVSSLRLPRGICPRAVDIIRAYTRHPNTTTFNFEGIKSKGQKNDDSKSATSILSVFSRPEEEIELGDIVKVITDVYEFSSRWDLKKPMHECVKYAHDHLSPEEIIQIIETLSTESFNYKENNYRGTLSDKNSQSQSSQKSSISQKSFDVNYVGYHYDGIIDTSGFDQIVAQHLEKYIQYFYRLPFYKINQLFHLTKQIQNDIKTGKRRTHRKNPNDLQAFALSTDDLILDFIVRELDYVNHATKEMMIGQFVDFNECSLEKLNELHALENGQCSDITGYTLEKLIEAKSEIVKIRSELNETKELLKISDENSNAYLTSLQQLFDNQHGFAESTYLNAVHENKVTCDEQQQTALFNVTVENKIPVSLFEKAKSLETVDPQESLKYYKELTETYDDQSDELVSQRALEWARSRDKTFLLPVLKMFIKTNRPKILLTCYEVSLIDFKVVPSPTGEKCLKRAVRLGFEQANHLYCEYLLLHDPRKCLKFCQDRSKEDPELEFNAGSILLLGCKGPSSEPKINSAGFKRRDAEIDEENMEPLASPIKIPDTPYLATPKSPNRRTPRFNASLNFTNDDENDDSDGEVYNMFKDVMQMKIQEDEEEMYKDKFVNADPERALFYFKKAAHSGFNVANLVLAVISPSERQRREYYDHFMINSSFPQPETTEEDNFEQTTQSNVVSDRIFPRSRFVIRVCLALFDMIVEKYPNLEDEMIELVNTLVIQEQDPSATEFLMQRSTSGALFVAFARAKPQLSDQQQEIINKLREQALVQLPAVQPTVHQIQDHEFEENGEISEVLRIPEYVKTVGERSFYKCPNLKCVEFDYEVKKESSKQSRNDHSMESLGNYAFYGCNSLQAIFFKKVKDNTKPNHKVKPISLGDSTFSNCKQLFYVELPENLVKIEDRLFFGCDKLISIDIPRRTQEIGASAFEGCKSLEYLGLHDGIKELREGCFQFCDKLKVIIIPKSIKSIASRSFRFCFSTTSIFIAEGVQSIEREAFHGCKSLAFVAFPRRSLKLISKKAFTQCPELKKVTLSRDTIVEEGAFDEGCEILFYDEAYDDDFDDDNDNEQQPKTRNIQLDDIQSKSSHHKPNDKSSTAKTDSNGSRSSRAPPSDKSSKSSKAQIDDKYSKSSRAKTEDDASRSSRHSARNDTASKSSRTRNDDSSRSSKSATGGLKVRCRCNPPNPGLVHGLASEINVSSSGQLNGRDPSSIIQENPSHHWYTESDGKAWVLLEFQSSLINPTHYAIWSHGGTSTLRNWCFQGSNDRQNWTDLSVHQNDESIREPLSKGEWPISTNQTFKYFRLMQTGENWAGNKWLYLRKIDLWGVAYEKKD